MAGKRVSLASLAASKVEAVPGASRPDLVHVHPDTVAPTPLNPRRIFSDEELTELGEDMRSGQLQPCVAVNKAAYLKLYPEHAEQLPENCRYVMAAGERRWRAAVKVGLDSLDLLLRHDLTESRIRFLAAVLSENVQRANFNPIEEADGLQAMLDLHDGNQAAAARAMKKSKAWFNQRIGLLRLTDQMVQLVFTGELTAFREMRRYAAMPPEEQYAAWKADREQPRPAKAVVQQPVQEAEQQPVPAPPAYTAVYAGPAEPVRVEPPETVPKQLAEPETYTAVYASAGPATAPLPVQAVPETAPGPGPESVPEPRTAPPAPVHEEQDHQQPRPLPYNDGAYIAMHLIKKMPDEEFDRMLDILVDHRQQRGSTR